MLYILVETAEREINAEAFHTLEKAQETMKRYFKEAGNARQEYIGETEAYKTNRAITHTNIDWRIIEIKEENIK